MAEQRNPEVFSWLKTLPLAPEYHPTIQEFQDPIAYIFKIEKEASTFGICKIVPPLPPQPKRAAITNLNRSLAARNPNSEPTFTTRQQQIGFCPRKQRPIQKSVWQSGERYTPHEFEVKAKGFEKNYVKNGSKKGLSALEVETLYWKANGDRPFSVEYANDMAGSAFGPVKEKGNGGSVGDTAWNMRGVARAKGSLLRFMKEDIPGVTSPMVYIAMMFSWFAWHVEDHDLHSLNYLHMGAGKTWYGVPRDAAMAFEEVIRVHGYGDEINPLVTFATLGEKTTVMSPEVLINAGVPCCRLVQNAGEFVVTFPRAYHSGFSHGYNCGEASNIATPEWLKFAKDAAIRRASINCPPMVSHFQLLYDLALSICSSNPLGGASEPRSSRLKDKKKGEGENLVKQMFVQDVMQNNDLLHALGKGSIVVLLPQSSAEKFVCSNFHIGSKYKVKPRLPFSLSSPEEPGQASEHPSPGQQVKQPKAFYLGKGNFSAVSEGNSSPWIAGNDRTSVLPYGSKNLEASEENAGEHGISESGLFTCVKCGIWTFACVAIVQPTEEASQYLMSADCNFLNDWIVGSGVSSGGMIVSKSEANVSEPDSVSGSAKRNIRDGLYDVPVHSADDEIKIEDISNTEKTFKMTLDTDNKKNPSALGLLAMTYGNSSDSDEDSDSPDDNNRASRDGSWGRFQNHDSVSPTSPQDHNSCVESDLSLSSNDYHGKYARGAKNNDRGREMNSSNVLNAAKTRTNAVIVPVETPNTHFGQRCGHDASRMHIFCLEHALEVEQQLRPIGGVHIFLLCHPDYPKVEAEAKKVSEELDMDYTWKDIAFAEASEEDEERILLALETEEATPKNGDWSVKLGINLFYSAILSRSPLYSKQMPFNSVIYNAFGYSSPSNSPVQEKYRLCVGRQKKLVMAGRWCGKVWMSNQVHPLLVKRDPDYDEERTFNSCLMSNENIERKTEVGVEAQCASTSRKAVSKRKMKGDGRLVKRPKWHDKEIVYAVSEEDSLADDKSQDEPKISERKTKLEHKLIKPRTRRMKEVRESDPDSPNSEPRQAHRRSVRKLKTRMKPSKKGLVQERESVKSDSDDALNNEFRIRNRKNGKKMKKMASREREIIPSDSEGSLDDESEPRRCRLEASWPRAVFQRVRHQFESISRGPSTRLRKRPANHPAEPETKPVSKKHPSKTSRKNAPERTLKHDEEGEFCCDIEGCTMSFGSRQELIVHKRNICPVKGCGKKFFSHKYLVQHRRVHMDDRPLKCPWKGCRMSFKWAWARTEHIRVHTGARPYVCNEPGCGQTFRFVSDFSRHKRKTGHSTKKGKR